MLFALLIGLIVGVVIYLATGLVLVSLVLGVLVFAIILAISGGYRRTPL